MKVCFLRNILHEITQMSTLLAIQLLVGYTADVVVQKLNGLFTFTGRTIMYDLLNRIPSTFA